MSPRRHMVALLRNTALRVSVLSKNGTVFWGMPDLVLSVGSVVNKLCDVEWAWPESQLPHLSKGVVSPSPDTVVRFQSWHVWRTWSHLYLWLVELAIAKNWVRCVCVCVRTCMCATGQGFAAQKELTPMRLMNSLVEHEGCRAILKSTALEWDRPGFHSEFHHLPVLWQFLSSCVTSLPQFPYLTHKGSNSTHLTE